MSEVLIGTLMTNAILNSIAQVPIAPTTRPARTLSGVSWVNQFPNSRDTATLADDFRLDVEAFIRAMGDAGATVTISSTLRPLERAYLMHYAWRIVREDMDPSTVPAMAGVDIDWVHRDANGNQELRTSRAAAQEMVDGYDLVHRPSLTTRHTEGHAIDMSIAWTGTLNITDASGSIVTIASTPRTGSNSRLIEVGATFGVVKLLSDPPHWSNDGH